MFLKEFYKKTWHRIILEKKLKKYSHLIKDNIIDIGSKNRRYDSFFEGKIIAVDIEPNSNNKVEYGNLEKGLSFKNEEFDSLICVEVLEYITNIDKAIEEIHRLLKINGQAIITIPFLYHEHEDKVRYTEKEILNKLKIFSDTKIEKIGNGYIVIWDIIRKKIIIEKKGILKKILFMIISLILILLIILNLEKIKDKYYSGLFIMIKK